MQLVRTKEEVIEMVAPEGEKDPIVAAGAHQELATQLKSAATGLQQEQAMVKKCNTLLWKICIMVHGISPYRLLSPAHGLRSWATPAVGQPLDDAARATPAWSRRYSEYLGDILAHQMLRDADADLVRFILKFAVICRTQDRRQWRFSIPDRVRHDVGNFEGQQLEDEAPHVWFNSLYQALPSPSPLARLLLQVSREAIAAHGPTTSPACPLDPRGDVLFRVETVDVQTVRKALRTVGGEGDKPQVLFDTFSARPRNVAPSVSEIAELTRLSWLHEADAWLRYLNAPSIAAPVPTPAQAASQAAPLPPITSSPPLTHSVSNASPEVADLEDQLVNPLSDSSSEAQSDEGMPDEPQQPDNVPVDSRGCPALQGPGYGSVELSETDGDGGEGAMNVGDLHQDPRSTLEGERRVIGYPMSWSLSIEGFSRAVPGWKRERERQGLLGDEQRE